MHYLFADTLYPISLGQQPFPMMPLYFPCHIVATPLNGKEMMPSLSTEGNNAEGILLGKS